MTGWNMPPGCNVSDIPGNSPGDMAAEAFEEFIWERFTKAIKILVTRMEKLWKGDVNYRAAEAVLETLYHELGEEAVHQAITGRGYMSREPGTFYPGDILRNGATVLGYRRFDDRRVVLAKAPGELSALPYVTWRMDEQGECYWGHYFKTEAEAAEDFVNRK